jgi:Flp pilus assembly pilin Flp
MNELVRLVCDDNGQDLVEYAFLCAFVALVTAAGWAAVRDALASTYGVLDTAEQDLWKPPDPIASSGGS